MKFQTDKFRRDQNANWSPPCYGSDEDAKSLHVLGNWDGHWYFSKKTMPHDRFQSHLHLVNLDKPAENNDVFFKVRPLYDASRCLESPLEENLYVDEQMLPFLGTTSKASHNYQG